MRLRFRFLPCLLLASSLQAHSDPRGEKHPGIQTDAQGNFRITFSYADQAQNWTRYWMSMVIAEDGRELIPRHQLSPPALRALGLADSTEESGDRPAHQDQPDTAAAVITISTPEGKRRLALREGNQAAGAALTLPFDAFGEENVEKYTITPHYVAVLSMLYPSESATPDEMILRTCRRQGSIPGRQLGFREVGKIYDFPSASLPVWVNQRFWVAWVRERGPEEARTWTTVLTGFDPETGVAEHHDLPGLSHWNTHVDLVANAHGTLCAAWTASLDGSYPGFAKIVTAVFPTKR